ncbi:MULTISPECIES: hypothetical protein [Bacillaceae]|nr:MULTISPECIES: hypothetical protein [Bacillaceae]
MKKYLLLNIIKNTIDYKGQSLLNKRVALMEQGATTVLTLKERIL